MCGSSGSNAVVLRPRPRTLAQLVERRQAQAPIAIVVDAVEHAAGRPAKTSASLQCTSGVASVQAITVS